MAAGLALVVAFPVGAGVPPPHEAGAVHEILSELSLGAAINDAGQVAGLADDENDDRHGFAYDTRSGQVLELIPDRGDFLPFDINESGAVSGTVWVDGPNSRAPYAAVGKVVIPAVAVPTTSTPVSTTTTPPTSAPPRSSTTTDSGPVRLTPTFTG